MSTQAYLPALLDTQEGTSAAQAHAALQSSLQVRFSLVLSEANVAFLTKKRHLLWHSYLLWGSLEATMCDRIMKPHLSKKDLKKYYKVDMIETIS